MVGWGGGAAPSVRQLPPLVQAVGRSRVTMSSGAREAEWKQLMLEQAQRQMGVT